MVSALITEILCHLGNFKAIIKFCAMATCVNNFSCDFILNIQCLVSRMYMILIFLNLLCSLIPDSSSMDLSFLLSMVSKVRLVQSKHKSSQEQKRLGKMCCPRVDYTFLGC